MAALVTAVVGPPRSGTSCVTGLLERSGFDLGRDVLVSREPSRYAPEGHYESALCHAINRRLLHEAGGDAFLFQPPPAAIHYTALRRPRYFDLFLRRFDGDLVKDPLLTLTWPQWEERWPALGRAIYCLRHPCAVARSIAARYPYATAEDGMRTWHVYATRFLEAEKRSRVYVLDFDAFCREPAARLGALLAWLGRPASEAEVHRRLDGFFSRAHVHWPEGPDDALPPETAALYARLRVLADPVA